MKTLGIIAAIGLFAFSISPASAKGKKDCIPAGKPSVQKTIPEVTYPFSFTCQHCQMKITVKSADDWSKSCGPCACGVTNLDCYKPPKK